MSSLNMRLVILFLLLALPTSPSQARLRRSPGPYSAVKWRVHVVNGLSNDKILFVHCKSGDDDLGVHNLSVGGETTWKFKLNVFASTLYWCYLSLREEKVHANLNVFWDDTGLFTKCNRSDCIWTAKDDGIYLKNIPENHDEFRHKWEQGC